MSFASSGGLRLILAKSNLLLVPALAGLSHQSSLFSSGSSTAECESSKKIPVNVRRRMTPIGRFSMESETLLNPSIASGFMTLSGAPLSPSVVIKLWNDRNVSDHHPRFLQRVSDKPGYFEDASGKQIDSYVSEALHPLADTRREVMSRIQNLQTATWDLGESLWHLYVAPWRERRRSAFGSTVVGGVDTNKVSYLFFRMHHALADGASFTAALMDLFDEAEEFRARAAELIERHRKRSGSVSQKIRRQVLQLLWFLQSSIQAIVTQMCMLILAALESNPWRMIQHSSVATLEHPADRVVSFVDAAAPIDQVKWVARQLSGPKATVNDVFVSCVTSALAKQLQYHRKSSSRNVSLPLQKYMHICIPVHLTGGIILPGESLGNKLGAFVVRLPGESDDSTTTNTTNTMMSSEERLKRVHRQLYAAKQTAAPIVSHLLAKSLAHASHILPSSLISYIFTHANAGSIAVVTNFRGPPHAIHLGGRKVETFHGFVPLPPGIPIGVVVSSYDGKVTVTVTAEPWAVPDGDQFLGWVLEEYLNLLRDAKARSRSSSVVDAKSR